MTVMLLIGAGVANANALSCQGWTIISSPNHPSRNNFLNGVAALSTRDVWAVGDAVNVNTGVGKTLTEHWNGTAWSIVASPNLGFVSTQNTLKVIAAVSPTDIWAVGDAINFSMGGEATLIEHWNGTTWRIVASPNPGTFNALSGVAVVSASDIWAVGSFSPSKIGQTLIEHWDGTAWSVVPSPNPGSSNDALTSVAVVSATDIWAVGINSNANMEATLVEHWDGTAWSVVPSANPSATQNVLYGVKVVSQNNIWAAGFFLNSDGISESTLIEHWDGTTWSVVPSPNGPLNGNILYGITVVSAKSIWAVGETTDNSSTNQTLIEQWNGTMWRVVSSPNIGSQDILFGAGAVPETKQVWAVGYYANKSNVPQTLTEFYCQ